MARIEEVRHRLAVELRQMTVAESMDALASVLVDICEDVDSQWPLQLLGARIEVHGMRRKIARSLRALGPFEPVARAS